MSLPVVDDFTITEEDIATPTVCESSHCEKALKKPTHEAHYYGLFPCCSFLYAICRERAEQFPLQPNVECNCGALVDGLTVRVTEIPK